MKLLYDHKKIHTDKNESDMMTKSLLREKHELCGQIVGLVKPSTYVYMSLEGKLILLDGS